MARVNAAKGSLNADDQQILLSLRALQEKITLPTELETKMMELEAKTKASMPAISHAQVNKLSKLRSQIGGLMDKVHAADQEWQRFMGGVLERVHTHVQAYQAHRQGLVDTILTKREELAVLKQDHQASVNLNQGDMSTALPAEAPDMASALQELQRLSQPLPGIPTVNVEDNEQDGEVHPDAQMSLSDIEEDGHEDSVLPKVTKHSTYRQSPVRPKQVAKDNLKEKNRGKSERQEEKSKVEKDGEA